LSATMLDQVRQYAWLVRNGGRAQPQPCTGRRQSTEHALRSRHPERFSTGATAAKVARGDPACGYCIVGQRHARQRAESERAQGLEEISASS